MVVLEMESKRSRNDEDSPAVEKFFCRKADKPGQTDYLLREYKIWKQTSQIENERYHICVLIFRNNDLLYFLHGFCGQIQRSVGGEHHVTDGHW